MDEDSIFIEKHIGLIHDVALRKFKRWMIYEEEFKREELIQEGMLGLLRAREKFEEKLGYQFSTYAYQWIWGKMSRYIQNQNKIKMKDNEIYSFEKRMRVGKSDDEDELEYMGKIADKQDYKDTELMIFLESLSEIDSRYLDICNLLIQGYTQDQIADKLKISSRTVWVKVRELRQIISKQYLKCS